MLETSDKIGYEEWDSADFVIPNELILAGNSNLADALRVFFAAGGYDFFKVIDPEKYASNWLDFIGNLYADIEDGIYKHDEGHFAFPLSENERDSLIEQGVPDIFTRDY